MSEEEYELYTRGKVADDSKFDKFFNFTISVVIPNDSKRFYFKK
jgi:hypothetical protein